ncbi:hypothetical protein ACHAWF_015098 [Thalassiosira exigua]
MALLPRPQRPPRNRFAARTPSLANTTPCGPRTAFTASSGWPRSNPSHLRRELPPPLDRVDRPAKRRGRSEPPPPPASFASRSYPPRISLDSRLGRLREPPPSLPPGPIQRRVVPPRAAGSSRGSAPARAGSLDRELDVVPPFAPSGTSRKNPSARASPALEVSDPTPARTRPGSTFGPPSSPPGRSFGGSRRHRRRPHAGVPTPSAVASSIILAISHRSRRRTPPRGENPSLDPARGPGGGGGARPCVSGIRPTERKELGSDGREAGEEGAAFDPPPPREEEEEEASVPVGRRQR